MEDTSSKIQPFKNSRHGDAIHGGECSKHGGYVFHLPYRWLVVHRRRPQRALVVHRHRLQRARVAHRRRLQGARVAHLGRLQRALVASLANPKRSLVLDHQYRPTCVAPLQLDGSTSDACTLVRGWYDSCDVLSLQQLRVYILVR